MAEKPATLGPSMPYTRNSISPVPSVVSRTNSREIACLGQFVMEYSAK